MSNPNLLPASRVTKRLYESSKASRLHRLEIAAETVARLLLRMPDNTRTGFLYVMGDVQIQSLNKYPPFIHVVSVGAGGSEMPELWVNEDNFAVYPKTRKELGYFISPPANRFDINGIETIGMEVQESTISGSID